ncbi:MAG: anthranilate synthase component I family protein [Candidatus Bipolaricaulota bacterium]
MVGFGSSNTSKTTDARNLLAEDIPLHQGEDSLVLKRLGWKISDPFEIYSRLYPHFQNSFILESSAGPEEFAKYTFLGFDPRAVLSFKNGRFVKDGEEVLETPHPLPYLKQAEEDFPNPPQSSSGKYLGGLVGYASYDFIRYLEDLPGPENESEFPDLQLGLFLDGIVHDRDRGTLTYFSYGEDRSSHLEEMLYRPPKGPRADFQIRELSSDFSREEFLERVRKAKDYIFSGDIYQTVLSRRLTGRFKGDQLQAYRNLRKINPSPYMYHLKFGERRIIGSSPEKLVSVTDQNISTYPIAGTRPIGESESERKKFRKDLLNDEKEQAEHNMLVDLARNDVGRVAKYGTVQVPQYMEVREFSHVQHIVSQVTGRLPEGGRSLDALGALFPAGTVSGAPKIRAMELIDQLEASPRGPYAGAVGYLSYAGDLDSCITIRSLYTVGDRIFLRAGAGIVADSDPRREWEEINHKLGALRDAVSSGGAGDDS